MLFRKLITVSEKVLFLKEIMGMGIRMSVLEIPDDSVLPNLVNDLSVRTTLGVVVDLDCPNVNKLLSQVSETNSCFFYVIFS